MMIITQDYPCRKLLEWLLLKHRNQPWKINKKIIYPRFLPHSKKYIIKWIENNLHGSVHLMMTEMLKSMTCPKILESGYKKFHIDIWKILSDSNIRELVELDLFFGVSTDEVYERLNDRLKPRIIDILAL